MQRIFKYFLLSLALVFGASTIVAQTTQHTVKKKETLYSISREYGITIDDLIAANPEMKSLDYKLKKGNTVNIPSAAKTAAKPATTTATATPSNKDNKDDVRTRAIRLGIMLPLHDKNGDGNRMVEYYRGVLMACDSLKKEGISVDIHAWNVAEEDDISKTLTDPAAAKCDLIIGPLYSKQVAALSKFTEKNNILLLIPFSIQAPELYTNRNMFQVYQRPEDQTEATVRRFCEWFKDYHPIIVDCGDTQSTKGQFTAELRHQLDLRGMKYSLTSLQSNDGNFLKAFSPDRKNVVVLNTARSPELNATFGKLSAVATANPNLHISMFGYTEWLMYVTYQLENFYRYNVYVPAPFYTNLTSAATERLQQKYRWNFHQDMMQALPRFALTGFDHALFFLRGLHKYGMTFDGAAGRFGYAPVQTPLKFERIGDGGFQNRAYMFVHYLPEHKVETVNY